MSNIELPEEFVPGIAKPEEFYRELNELAGAIAVPVPMMHLGIQVHDGDGNIIHEHFDRSRTFVRNYWNLLFGLITQHNGSFAGYGNGYLSAKKADGNLTTVASAAYATLCYLNAAVASGTPSTTSNNQYIQFGTSAAAESFEHWSLQGPIAHGTGAGQLSYSATFGRGTPAYDAGTKTWTSTISGVANNNTASSITVNEIGYFGGAKSAGGNIMLSRDVLGTPVTVPASGAITATYTLSLAFPA